MPARALERDVQELPQGRERLLISNGEPALQPLHSKRRNHKPASSREPRDISSVGQRLIALESRDEGLQLLSKAELGRSDLERLARQLELPVRKDDTVERLRDRIIEATIGARLSSRAIRG